MNIWDALKQYIGDAMPGGALNPEVTPQGLLDSAALVSSPVPIAGDLLGVAADAYRMRDPAERTPLNYALMALGALPLVPGGLRALKQSAPSAGARAIPNQEGAIKVFHGSPHKFDKFDLSKIGTGEGAQAYGHGGYFAESESVAKSYADNLPRLNASIDGRPVIESFSDGTLAQQIANKTGLARADAIEAAQAVADSVRTKTPLADILRGKTARTVELYGQAGMDAAGERARLANMEKVLAPIAPDVSQGHLYEASLRWPDAAREAADPMQPGHFLDWDKPLSQQPAKVREVMEPHISPRRAIEARAAGPEWGDLAAPRDYDPPGSELLKLFRGSLDRMDANTVLTGGLGPEVSAKLWQQGIPGIRYLDNGSRRVGEGTSNYVVFDDAMLEILKRNGIAVK